MDPYLVSKGSTPRYAGTVGLGPGLMTAVDQNHAIPHCNGNDRFTPMTIVIEALSSSSA